MTPDEWSLLRKAIREEIPIQSVELLRPQPGDTVMVTVPDRVWLDVRQRQAIAEQFKRNCPGAEICVKPASIGVQILRPPPSLDMGIQRVGLMGVDAPEYKPATGPSFEAKDAPIQPHA